MDFISNSSHQQKEMLRIIGVSSIDELFKSIPSAILQSSIALDDGLSESEGMQKMEAIAAMNTYPAFDSYLGGGAYEHHVPAIVGAICAKSEFLTAYTPYQPEVSQGMLQVIFEFQSVICALTGMYAGNASLYDGASACAEAALMALRVQTPKRKLLISASLHPSYKDVIRQYAEFAASEIIEIPFNDSLTIDESQYESLLDDKTAAVIIQSPNVFGCIENTPLLFEKAHANDSLAVQCGNPLAYGIFHSPSHAKADIAVGDCQPLGLPLNFGGPYVGYITCTQELLRQLPGRIVGETVDTEGRRGFVLTLQAREQHIRREKATSNVCTNQALAALASLVAILWYGKTGLPKLALTNYQRAAYLRHSLAKLPHFTVINNDSSFNEFVITSSKPIDTVLKHFRQAGIIAGFPLKEWFPSMENSLLLCATEMKSKSQLDRYVEVASQC
ncbi:MAG: aminomethyl-transferring glycine dehydrogenase subunit GcvPA [Parachlamydiales bacterium]|jgi:glycine dehydrogenase subunit 1